MLIGLGVLVVLLIGLLLLAPRALETLPDNWVSLSGGRGYLIDLPPQYDGAPMILALHGGAGNARGFSRNVGLSRPANKTGYAVIYPDGTGRWSKHSFNAGYCCGSAAREGVDDITYLDAVIADARTRYKLSAGPVVICGLSNGAMMAETYAAVRPEAVKAVMAVAGTLDLARFPPKGPVRLLIVHGTADQNVPFEGGLGPRSWNKNGFSAVRAVIAAFLSQWGNGLQTSERRTPTDAEGYALRETTWSRAGHPVLRLLAIEGGDHGWPGSQSARRKRRSSSAVSANTELLKFLADLG